MIVTLLAVRTATVRHCGRSVHILRIHLSPVIKTTFVLEILHTLLKSIRCGEGSRLREIPVSVPRTRHSRHALFDLYRYDTTTATWTSLTPVGFDFPFDTASLQGSNLVLSRWGLIRYGGYVRQPYMASTFKHGQVSNL